MNTPPDDRHDDDRNNLRYAEYVLGVLDADQRAAVAHELATSNEAATAVALWQRRLTPLAQTLPEVTPSEEVWSRIRAALNSDLRAPNRQPAGFWHNLRLWQWTTVGASFVAAACLVLLVIRPVQKPPEVRHGAFMVSSIRQDNGVTDWTATLDLDRKQIVVVPAASASIARDRSTQLWLIPAGQGPISVGVFPSNATSVLTLDANLLAKLGPAAALAVSVEPLGGSPTGQPTGPVIAKGGISSAPTVPAPG